MSNRNIWIGCLTAILILAAAICIRAYVIISNSSEINTNIATVAIPPSNVPNLPQNQPSGHSNARHPSPQTPVDKPDPTAGRFTLEETGLNSRSKRIALKEIVTPVYKFVLSLENESSRHVGKISGEDPKTWWLGDTTKIPAAGWRIMANARIIADFPQTADLAKKAMDRDFDEMIKTSNGERELWSIHQLYDSYKLIGDIRLFNYFWERIQIVAQYVRDRQRVPNRHIFLRENPTVLATLARQLAQAARALSDPYLVKHLNLYRMLPTSAEDDLGIKKLQQEYISLAVYLLDLMPKTDDGKNALPLVASPGTILPQYSCWDIWVRSELFLATKQTTYLNDVTAFFEKLQIDKRQGKDISILSLQTILPCAQTLQELRAELPSSTTSQLSAIYKRAILPLWDDPSSHLCVGDGGVMTNLPRPDQSICLNNSKSWADNSWLIFIVDKELGEIYVDF